MTFMDDLQLELNTLEFSDLVLDELNIKEIELSGQNGLESLTATHGMVEIGASVLPVGCCSCCIPCCCCCCLG